MYHASVHRSVMGNLLVKSWCKVGNPDALIVIFPLLSHALTGVAFLFARIRSHMRRQNNSSNIPTGPPYLRLQFWQEALRRLNEDLPEDAFRGDAIELFQRVYRDPNFDPQLRLDAAAKIAAFERKGVLAQKQRRVTSLSCLGQSKTWTSGNSSTWKLRPMPIQPRRHDLKE